MSVETILKKIVVIITWVGFPMFISVAIVGSIFERHTAWEIFKLIQIGKY